MYYIPFDAEFYVESKYIFRFYVAPLFKREIAKNINGWKIPEFPTFKIGFEVTLEVST